MSIILKDNYDLALQTIESRLLEYTQNFPSPVYHKFGPGIYIRELHMPAGIVGLGHKQKTTHVNQFVSGRIRLLQDNGKWSEDLVAPMTVVSPPGRKVVHVIETMIWQNIYATDETDVEILESMYLEKSQESVEYYNQYPNFTADELKYIKSDFCAVLKENNLTEAFVWEESNRESDMIKMPYEYCATCVRKSEISGKGVFVSAPIGKGNIIAPAVLNGKRTPASRYMNHSPWPTAKAVIKENGDIYFVATRNIIGCMSGDNGQEITVDYREAIKHRKRSLL